jgi:hypothetical protein
MKRTTVMVDADDLELIQRAAAREGRPEAASFREAFHLVALRPPRWADAWDIPSLDFGGRVNAEEMDRAVPAGVADLQ